MTPLDPTVTGTVTSFTVAPPLPTGLIIDPVTGRVSGTPLATTPSANYTITAANSGGATARAVTIRVDPARPPSPTVVYSGNVNPAQIDESRARAFAGDLALMWSIVKNLPRQLAMRSTITIVYDDIISGPGGGRAFRTGVLDAGIGWMSWRFDNYVDGVRTLNGIFTQDVRTTTLSDWTAEFTDLRIVEPSKHRRINGSVRESESPPVVSGLVGSAITTDLVMTDELEGDTLYAGAMTIDSTRQGLLVEETYGGRLYRSADGFVELVSNGSHVFDDGRPYAERGEVLDLEGANSLAGLIPLPARHFALVLDADADGSYERFARLAWDTLLAPSGRVVAYVDHHAPAVGNMGSDMRVAVGQSTMISAVMSHDADGSFIAADLTLALRPVGSAIDVHELATLVSFSPDVAGDYLFTARIRDPDGDAYDSVVLTATTGTVVPSEHRMRLDRPRPAQPGEFVPLDGSMSLRRQFLADVLWRWELIKPIASGAALASTNTPMTSFVADVPGFYRATVGDEFTSIAEKIFSVGLEVDFHHRALLSTGVDDYFRPAVADFDGDGRLDVASLYATSPVDSGIRLYLAVASDGFRAATFDVGALLQGNLATGDLTGDGISDLATAAVDRVLIVRGAAVPSLQTLALSRPASCTSSGDLTLAIADANADGREDLVMTDGCTHSVMVWLQGPSGTLGAPTTQTITEIGPGEVAIGDLNNDGRADLAFAEHLGYQNLFVMLRTQAGSFQLSQAFTDVPSRRVLIAEMTGDALPDVLLSIGSRMSVIRQLPNGTLAPPVDYFPGAMDSPIAVGDLDGNGRSDVLAADTTVYLIGLQNSAGGFHFVRLPAPELSSPWNSNAIVADLNGDGFPDIVRETAVSTQPGLEVWLQMPR